MFSYGTLQLERVQQSLFGRTYEPPEYTRVRVVWRSGTDAWVYVDALHMPRNSGSIKRAPK